MGNVSGGVSTYQSTPQDITGLRNNLSQWLQGLNGGVGYNGQTTKPNYPMYPGGTTGSPPTSQPPTTPGGFPGAGPGTGAPYAPPFPFWNPPTHPTGVTGTTAPPSDGSGGVGGGTDGRITDSGFAVDPNSGFAQFLKSIMPSAPSVPNGVGAAPSAMPAPATPAGYGGVGGNAPDGTTFRLANGQTAQLQGGKLVVLTQPTNNLPGNVSSIISGPGGASPSSFMNPDGSPNIQALMQMLSSSVTPNGFSSGTSVSTTSGQPTPSPATPVTPTSDSPGGYVDPNGYHAGGTPGEINPDGTPRTAVSTGPMAPLATAAGAFNNIFAQPVNSYAPINIADPGQVAQTTVGAAPTASVDPQTQSIIDSIMQKAGGGQVNPDTISSLLAPGSAFNTNILPALQAGFTAQRTQDLAQAKESAGNLTGSGLANAIGNATNKSLGTEQSTIAQMLTNLAGTQSGQNVSIAGINSAANTAGANTQSGVLGQLFGLGTTNAGIAGQYGMTQAQIDAQRASQNTSTAATLNSQQAQMLAQQMSQIFGNASSTNSQNAQAFLALLNSMSGTGVAAPTTVQTPSSIPGILGSAIGTLPFIM